jgi:excisionase family DNA binding protein
VGRGVAVSALLCMALPDGRWLALDREAFAAALAAGAEMMAAPAPSASTAEEPLLDAEQLAAALHVPVTWIEQAARELRIPSMEFGRWRRFKRSEVEAHVRSAREGKRA